MKPEPGLVPNNKDHFGTEFAPIRMLAAAAGWLTAGDGWQILRGDAGTDAGAEGWLLELPATPDVAAAALTSGLPLVLAVSGAAADAAPAALVDAADGYVLPGDGAAEIAAVIHGVIHSAIAPAGSLRVADGTAQIISALSAEASRIAAQLAQLAEQRGNDADPQRPVDAGLVRRLLRVRRERVRFFPADMFADPAWDMLLDLAAARLEGKLTPVSSLCIAAAVPTTTALRWVRSLDDAGLIERRPDPFDARRSHVQLSDAAADAMLGWLRLFAGQFAGR